MGSHVHPAETFRGQEVRDLQPGDHNCHVFETAEQSLMALVPFLVDGLKAGDRCVAVLSGTPVEDVEEALKDRGVDVQARIAEGDLTFRSAEEAYGEPDAFDVRERLADLEAMVREAREQGYQNVRSTAEMTWAVDDGLDRDTLARYEAAINRFLRGEVGDHLIGLCQYHLSAFEPEVAADVLRAHPLTSNGTRVRPNLFYQPPEVLLADDPQAAVDHMLDRLAARPGEDDREDPEQARNRTDRLHRFQQAVSAEVKDNLEALQAHLRRVEENVGKPWPGRAETSIAFALEGAGRIEERIEALVEYSHIETEGLDLSPVDSGEALSQARSNLDDRLENAAVELTHDPLPSLEADHDRLVSLFEQLVANALQHGGSRLSRIHVSVEDDGGACRFSIEDDGQGIPAHKREPIADALDRGGPPGSSPAVGPGLALCGRIVDRHGGRLFVEASSMGGARFSFTIPDSSDRSAQRDGG